MTDIKEMLRAEMDRQGMHNDDLRAGTAAIIGGESRFQPKWETGWSRTANSRIRQFFGSRVSGLSDVELDQIKRTDRSFFNHVYGSKFAIGQSLGNIKPEDGYRFRGGGLIQLTGRANYERYGDKIDVDLISDPDRINDLEVATAVAVAYMLDRYKGGGFEGMKKAVGVSIGEPNEEKNRLYAEYKRTGEWDYKGEVTSVSSYTHSQATKDMQTALKKLGFYGGRIDGDWGPLSRAAYEQFLRST